MYVHTYIHMYIVHCTYRKYSLFYIYGSIVVNPYTNAVFSGKFNIPEPEPESFMVGAKGGQKGL